MSLSWTYAIESAAAGAAPTRLSATAARVRRESMERNSHVAALPAPCRELVEEHAPAPAALRRRESGVCVLVDGVPALPRMSCSLGNDVRAVVEHDDTAVRE